MASASPSLSIKLPISYQHKIRQIDGVESVSYANWFGGIYIDERNFFPNFAVQLDSYLPLYPEFRFDPGQYKALLLNKRGCAVGEKLARRYGWKVGDVIPLKGTIFPGNYPLVVEAIFSGTRKNTDTNLLLFHWSHLNDRMEKLFPRRANNTGVFVIGISNPAQAAEIARHIDGEFRNSLAETLTETEKAFQLSFVAMTEAIVVAIEAVAYVVILIIMAVMANTMAMAARERSGEYVACADRRQHRHRPHLPGLGQLRAGAGQHIPGVQCHYRHFMAASRRGITGGSDRRHRAGNPGSKG